MFVSGNFGADYVATGVFVEKVTQLSDSVKNAPTGRKLFGPLSNDN
jgi:hypothetical protein